MTERDLTPEVIALIVAKKVEPVLFLLGDFPSGIRRLWSGRGDYTDDDLNVWQGIGGVCKIEGLEESVDSGAKGVKVTLNALDETLVGSVLTEQYQGRRAEIKLGFWDRNVVPGVIVFPTEPAWRGFMDMDESTISGRATDLTINCEHRMVDLLRKREIRYTDHDQQFLHPDANDHGLAYINQIQDKTIPWGKTQS